MREGQRRVDSGSLQYPEQLVPQAQDGEKLKLDLQTMIAERLDQISKLGDSRQDRRKKKRLQSEIALLESSL